jgi:hypothetical protein
LEFLERTQRRILDGIADLQANMRALSQHVLSLDRRLNSLQGEMIDLREQTATLDARLSLRLDRIERAVGIEEGK